MEFQLNKAQAEAVEHEEGSAIIIAGAGTGKTRVITQRIIRLLEKKKCLPENILALTFTDKASEEMRERVDLEMPLGFGEVKVQTFHSFCKEILAESGIEIGINPDFTLMDQVGSWIFIRENLTKFKLDYFRPLGNPTKFIANLSSHFSRLKEEDISPKNYLEYAENLSVQKITNAMLMEWEEKEAEKKRKTPKEPPLEEFQKEAELIVKKERELAKAYQIYDELLLKESKMDFGGLIYLALDLFRKRPNVLSEYQKKYQYIMVDEFQDTNFAQNELVEMLAQKHENLMVVGDDDQAIYKFRGASLSNILQFEERHPECFKFILTENYRSAQNILDLAYESIQHNNPNRLETKLGIDKRLLSQSAMSHEPRATSLWKFEDGLSEAERIAEEILSLVGSRESGEGREEEIKNEKLKMKNDQEDIRQETNNANFKVQVGGIEPTAKTPQPPFQGGVITKSLSSKLQALSSFQDIALLVRNRASADIFLGEFDRKGIPYQFVGNRGLYLQQEIKELINFLTVLANPNDNISLFGLMQSRYFDFKQIDLIQYLQEARKENVSLFNYLERIVVDKVEGEQLELIKNEKLKIKNDQEDIRQETNNANFKVQVGDIEPTAKTPQPPFQGGVITKSLSSKLQALSSCSQSLSSFLILLHSYIEKSQTMSVGQLLWDFLKERDFEKHLSKIAEEKGISACQLFSGNINEFFKRIGVFEEQSEQKTVLSFIDYLQIQIEAGDDPKTAESGDENAVQIMTIHKAKGLEFEAVFVPSLVQNKFPSTNRRETIPLADELVKETVFSEDFHTEEERRLFYVAITRAKEKLYLSYAISYNDSSKKWKRSDFLTEIIENPQINFQEFKQKAEVLDELESKFTVQKVEIKPTETAENLFNNYLSYTQINTYRRCPKLYHYRYLLHIPTEPSVSANFGSAVHDALKDFYREMKKKQQIPVLDSLLLYLKKNWKSSGYRDSTEEQDYFQKAREILQTFYASNQNNWIIPEKIEESFRIKLFNEAGAFITINGRIDRIDKLPDGSFEVIDYKTGQLTNTVIKELKNDLQLSLYAIATREFMALNSTKFSLYFLKDNQKISAERTSEILTEAKKEIWETVTEIKKGNFVATPSENVCQFCDYRKICPNAVA